MNFILPKARTRARRGALTLIGSSFAVGALYTALPAGSDPQRGAPATGDQATEDAEFTRNEPSVPPAVGAPAPSDAERIARLQRTIAENEKLLGELQEKFQHPRGEYAKAEEEFGRLDREFQEKKSQLHKLEGTGIGSGNALASEVAELEPRWKLAKERFDLAIKARRALQEQLATLEQKLRQEREALKKLTEPKPTAPVPAQPPTTEHQAGSEGPGTASPSPPAPLLEAAPPGGAPSEPAAAPPTASLPAAAGQPSPPAAAAPAASTGTPGPPNPRLIKAQEEAGQRASEAAEAQREAQSLAERVAALGKDIELERGLLANARQRADNAQETEGTVEGELRQRAADGARPSELEEMAQRVAESRERFREARNEIRERTDRLDRLQSELSELQAEQLAAVRGAEEKRIEAERAQKKLEGLKNPFAARNVLQWILDHGPRILLIVVGMALIIWVARLLERRITDWMAHHGKARGTTDDENRARTLVGVFHNAIRVVVILGGSLMVFAEAGVNIIPLMGGAAVLGLAAAFGGQSLLRDYFTGFMILLENQYAVNDVVRVGEVAGLVERITLRLTVLRDLDGTVHFIPNGHIATVTNMTHGWSRALFEIGVAYKEDVDRVMELLVEMGRELRRDPEFRYMILEQPEMLGVDELGDSAVIIKFYIKTRPLMQWTVKREMLRRIKRRFDELGIEIPFPQRAVHHRFGPGSRGRQREASAGGTANTDSR